MVTDPPTKNTPSHKQTGPITIHCTAASEQYNNNTKSGPSEQVSQSTSVHSASEALATMRYINLCFTYLLTYLLTY